MNKSIGNTQNMLENIADNYFEAELKGDFDFLKFYKKRPIIIVGNHAGGGLSWDNIIFDALFYRKTQELLGKNIKIKRLIHPTLYNDSVRPYLLNNWWKKMECYECNIENMYKLCEENEIIYISPEGVEGLKKGYHNRGKLVNFSSSFIHIAKKFDGLIVPNCVVNSEYILPYSYSIEILNKLINKFTGLPFITISPLLPLILFPKYFIVSMPVRLKYNLMPYIDSKELSQDNYESNKLDAEIVRKKINDYLSENKEKITESLIVSNIFSFGSNKKVTFNNLFQYFVEGELNRKLTRLEKLQYKLPLIGYLTIKHDAVIN